MNLSINPWYYCNFKCDFCYLTKTQLNDKTLLPIEVLELRLAEILSHSKIDMVDLYGGEIGILPYDYVLKIKELLHTYGIDDINLITNLSMINEVINDEDFYISVSYDFEAREKYEQVWKNMLLLNRPFSVLMLASPELMEKDVDEMIQSFNLISNLSSVEIKPYSPNQANQLSINYRDFEEFVKKWLTSSIEKNFEFANEKLIKQSISGKKNSFSDDHVYITPSGKYGVLEFDLNDNEFFLEYETFDEYLNWCEREKQRVLKNKFCSSCEYYGGCLSEHLREVKNLDNSCNGFKILLDWYKDGRMEN
jgi:sulfatase maturation enzyme AslB (radical SAM superfamily)